MLPLTQHKRILRRSLHSGPHPDPLPRGEGEKQKNESRNRMSLLIQSSILLQHGVTLLIQLQNQLAKQRVGPGEPCAGEFLWVVLVESFVHKARAGVGGFQHSQAQTNLVVTRARQSPHDDSQRPDHVQTNVRAADAFGRATLEEPGILLAENECTRAAIGSIIRRTAPQIWQREQTRNIRIIHKKLIAESVNFVSVSRSVNAVAGFSKSAYGFAYLMCQFAAIRRESCL